MMRTTLLTIAGVLAGLLATGCSSIPKGVEPVKDFEADRYLGLWYEIARLDHRFERNLTHVTAEYTRRDDGRIGVVNRGWDTRREQWREADAVARFRGSEDVGALSVTFQWPFSGGYNVFALDHENYQWALVCGPSRSYFWILAREKTLPDDLLEELVATARSYDFPTDDLIWVEQENRPPEE